MLSPTFVFDTLSFILPEDAKLERVAGNLGLGTIKVSTNPTHTNPMLLLYSNVSSNDSPFQHQLGIPLVKGTPIYVAAGAGQGVMLYFS